MSARIIFEDEAYERAFLAGELTEAGAVTLVGEGGALTSATTLRAVESEVREYLVRFGGEPFSPAALASLGDSLAPLFARCGYERDPDSPYVTVAFAADGEIAAPQRALPDGVSLVRCGEGEGERYDFSLIDGGADDGCCALAVRGDTVLCAAGINDLRRDGYCEIYVECAAGSRRLGLGSACAAMLARTILAGGRGVRYETEGENAASLALARSIGLRETERTVSFVALGK